MDGYLEQVIVDRTASQKKETPKLFMPNLRVLSILTGNLLVYFSRSDKNCNFFLSIKDNLK